MRTVTASSARLLRVLGSPAWVAAPQGMLASPLPSAAVPGQDSSLCSGGDSRRRYWRRSRPCHISAPANGGAMCRVCAVPWHIQRKNSFAHPQTVRNCTAPAVWSSEPTALPTCAASFEHLRRPQRPQNGAHGELQRAVSNGAGTADGQFRAGFGQDVLRAVLSGAWRVW